MNLHVSCSVSHSLPPPSLQDPSSSLVLLVVTGSESRISVYHLRASCEPEMADVEAAIKADIEAVDTKAYANC